MGKMKQFLVLLAALTVSCATEGPKTELELLRAEQIEQERVEMFRMWLELCPASGGYVYIDNWTYGRCDLDRPDCAPHKIDWKFKIITQSNGKQRIVVRSTVFQCLNKR